MTKNKKIIISAVVAVLLIVLIGIGTIFTINSINTNKTKKASPVEATKAVNNLRADAEKARASGDKADSKTLLLQAQQQVQELPKTDKNTNTEVDIKAQLYLLEHAK